jgi:hypothetical protein
VFFCAFVVSQPYCHKAWRQRWMPGVSSHFKLCLVSMIYLLGDHLLILEGAALAPPSRSPSHKEGTQAPRR